MLDVEEQGRIPQLGEPSEPGAVGRPRRPLSEPAPDLVEHVGRPAAQVGQPGFGPELGQQPGQGHPRLVELAAGQLPLPVQEAVARFQPPPCDALFLAPGLGTHDGVVPQQARDEDHQGEQTDGDERGRRRAASGPLQRALPGGRAAGVDWLAGQEAAQVHGQLPRIGVALMGLFLQALQADRLQVARDFRLEPRGGDGGLTGDQHDRLQRRRAMERRPAGELVVQDRAQGVDVGRRSQPHGSGRWPVRGPCRWACR